MKPVFRCRSEAGQDLSSNSRCPRDRSCHSTSFRIKLRQRQRPTVRIQAQRDGLATSIRERIARQIRHWLRAERDAEGIQDFVVREGELEVVDAGVGLAVEDRAGLGRFVFLGYFHDFVDLKEGEVGFGAGIDDASSNEYLSVSTWNVRTYFDSIMEFAQQRQLSMFGDLRF